MIHITNMVLSTQTPVTLLHLVTLSSILFSPRHPYLARLPFGVCLYASFWLLAPCMKPPKLIKSLFPFSFLLYSALFSSSYFPFFFTILLHFVDHFSLLLISFLFFHFCSSLYLPLLHFFSLSLSLFLYFSFLSFSLFPSLVPRLQHT